jgi:hypothetical protein
MKVRTLHAKRISHNTCEVFVQLGPKRSEVHVVNTTDLLVAAARHVGPESFDAFYGSMVEVGSYASLPSEGLDEIASDLGVDFDNR